MPKSRQRKPSTVAALRGALQAGVAGTVAVSTLAESIHLAVLATPTLSLGRGLTRAAYAGVRGVAGVVGQGGDRLLEGLGRALSPTDASHAPLLPLSLGAQAALNGVAGDRLARMGHASALPMSLVPHRRVPKRRGDPSSGEVLFVHGLCMHDRHWQSTAEDRVDFGAHLREQCALAPIYLRYNSGLPIAESGRRLALLLARRERALRRAPGPLQVVTHSLGGLVFRSAVAWAEAQGQSWPRRLGNVVFLGTPHQGAPLERAGRVLESLLGVSRFSAPWAAVGRLRSMAIRQLGDAEVAPWPTNLDGVRLHAIAGCLTRRGPQALHEHWGDGLVPVRSALASAVPVEELPIQERTVLDGLGHLDLIGHPRVAHYLIGALT